MLGFLIATAAASGPKYLGTEPRRGVWAYFCYQDTASIAGSEANPLTYPARCWEEQSVKAAPAAQGTLMMVKWRHIEPSPGRYDWREFDANISKATGLNLQLIVAVEICKADAKDEAAPEWLYSEVPAVAFNVEGTKKCPYYLNGRFQVLFRSLISALAVHLSELPSREMVVGVQAMLGITGDDRPWAATPINKSYVITDSEWTNYTRVMSQAYCAAFTKTGRRVLFNLENPGYNGTDDPWVLRECPGSLLKQGIVSHGYQLNTELDLYELWRRRGLDVAYTRGELALEPNPTKGTYGNWAQAPHWSLQANAEWCLQFGLAQWNLYAGFLSNESFAPTLEFFNRQAPSTAAATATAAFLSFRDALDTADTERWPVATFGAVNVSHGEHGTRLNQARMLSISGAMEPYGARIENVTECSSFKSVVQKKGNYLNDVGYRIWPGNYAKFLTQQEASTTSVGRWRVGPREQGYGRFARALEQKSGKSAIRLSLAPQFAAEHRYGASNALNVTLRVVYFDEGHGRWTLTYTAEQGRSAAMNVLRAGTGRWKEAECTVQMVPNDASEGFDFELRSLSGEDEVFSLFEVIVNAHISN